MYEFINKKKNIPMYILFSLLTSSFVVGINQTVNSQNSNTRSSSFATNQISSDKKYKKRVKSLEVTLMDEFKKINKDFRQQENKNIGWYAKSKENNSNSIVILLADNHKLSQELDIYNPIFDILKKYSSSFGLEGSEYGMSNHFKSTVDLLNLMLDDNYLSDRRFNESDIFDSSKLSKKIASSNVRIYGYEDKNLIITSNVCDHIYNLIIKMVEGAAEGTFSESDILQHDAEIKRLYRFLDESQIIHEMPEYYTNRILDGTLVIYHKELGNYLTGDLVNARTLSAVSNIQSMIKLEEAKKGPIVTTIVFGRIHMDLVMEKFDNLGVSYIFVSNPIVDNYYK